MDYYEIMIGFAIGGTVGAGVGYFLVKASNVDQREERLQTLKELRKVVLDNARKDTTCANALLLKIHNGGGKLIEGENWYSSVLDESPERNSVSAKSSWQNMVVDDAYKLLIKEIRTNKKTFLETEKMPPSFLRRTYERMGIIGSIVMEVYSSEYAYYYVSYPVRENLDKAIASGDFNILEIATFQLQKKYRKYDAYGVLELE